ncbi:MAG: hypothetical protein SPI12_05675 [Actinomycetaceae bacterium]|nr:hypothetical protein [Actinomycetaceae bacterium]MDY6083328.1 hypothetical protein [Actinomycetaceae bacterium]
MKNEQQPLRSIAWMYWKGQLSRDQARALIRNRPLVNTAYADPRNLCCGDPYYDATADDSLDSVWGFYADGSISQAQYDDFLTIYREARG